jgi:hypothetical protein
VEGIRIYYPNAGRLLHQPEGIRGKQYIDQGLPIMWSCNLDPAVVSLVEKHNKMRATTPSPDYMAMLAADDAQIPAPPTLREEHMRL